MLSPVISIKVTYKDASRSTCISIIFTCSPTRLESRSSNDVPQNLYHEMGVEGVEGSAQTKSTIVHGQGSVIVLNS